MENYKDLTFNSNVGIKEEFIIKAYIICPGSLSLA